MRARNLTFLVLAVALLVVGGFVLVLQSARSEATRDWRAAMEAWDEADPETGEGTHVRVGLAGRRGWGTLFHHEWRQRRCEIACWPGSDPTDLVLSMDAGPTSDATKVRVDFEQRRRWLHHDLVARVTLVSGEEDHPLLAGILSVLEDMDLRVERAHR